MYLRNCTCINHPSVASMGGPRFCGNDTPTNRVSGSANGTNRNSKAVMAVVDTGATETITIFVQGQMLRTPDAVVKFCQKIFRQSNFVRGCRSDRVRADRHEPRRALVREAPISLNDQ